MEDDAGLLKAEIKELKADLASSKKAVDALTEEVAGLRKVVKTKQAELDAANEQVRVRVDQVDQLRKALDA